MDKNSKMISCRHCGEQIAVGAKSCPHCGGKNKKPFYKKPLIWVLVALGLIVAIGSGGKGDSSKNTGSTPPTTSASSSQSTVQTDAPKTDVQTAYHVGDTLHDGNMDIVYAASGEYTETNQFSQPAEGKKYIFLKLAFINTSQKSDTSISLFSFNCYADGYAADRYHGGEDDLSATLSAGRATIGYLYFEVPVDAEKIEIEYETNAFTEKKIYFDYDGDKDSGYELEKTATATENALKVGDTMTGNTLNMTYLACQDDSSYHPYIAPKEGYRFVTCEFEFENVSKSDVTISGFSFDCYADGASCKAQYFREDFLSATLSPGRKTKGTVTFEVPADATVVEVEYLTNFWTSSRIVFDASAF